MRLGSRGLYRFDPGVIRGLLDQARGQTIEGDLVSRPRAGRLGTASTAVEPEHARAPVEVP
jgi:hypothetical protein